MAGRIRTVKPEWIEDEKMVLASPGARTASIGLLLIADDYGRGVGNRDLMVSRIFPGHHREGHKAIVELDEMGFVSFYEVRGQTYFQIINWKRHQKVDKPGKPRVPCPCGLVEKDHGCPENILESLAKVPESLAPDHDLIPRPNTNDHDHDQGASPQVFASVLIAELNRLTGRNFAVDGKEAIENAKKLIASGFTPEQGTAVVKAKHREWKGNDHMRKQLKPSVLMRPSNFRKYLEEDVGNGAATTRLTPGQRLDLLNEGAA